MYFTQLLFSHSNNCVAEHLKTGITVHAKTLTSLRGANVRAKLDRVCRSCFVSYTVKLPSSNLQVIIIYNIYDSSFAI